MLYVTMIENNTEEEQKILRNFPEAKICLVENRGYDIWPFINLLQSINLDDFDYILKLHTKSFYEEAVRVNKLWYKEYEWRNIMVDCLLKDNNRFLQLLDRFESSPGTGMFCSRLFFMPLSDFLPEDTSALRKEMERIGLHTKPGHFITGTIFIARSKPFKLLQNGRCLPSFRCGRKLGRRCFSQPRSQRTCFGCFDEIDQIRNKVFIPGRGNFIRQPFFGHNIYQIWQCVLIGQGSLFVRLKIP